MAEQNLGLWKRESDFTEADRLAVERLRRHVADAQSDECLLWIVQVVSMPRRAREEAALQRRMGRIPRDRPLLLKIHDRQGFEAEVVDMQVERMTELPPSAAGRGHARLDAMAPYWARAGILSPPLKRPGREFGSWLLCSACWAGAYLLVRELIRSFS
jgi:hypothetical protein